MSGRVAMWMTAPLVVLALIQPGPASAAYSCGAHNDDFNCGGNNPYPCCDNGGNCTWWAWDRACRGWVINMPAWGNAKTWAQNAANNPAYTVLTAPVVGSIGVRDIGTYGHVAWVTAVNGSNVTVSEMNCDLSPAGPVTTSRPTSFFNAGFIVRAGTAVECSTANGKLIKAQGDATVYYMLNGRRWAIHNEQMFWALGLDFSNVCTAPASTVNNLPLGPIVGGEGSMFLCNTCAEPTAVYLIQNGQRHHIDNEWVLQTCLGMSLNDVFTKGTSSFQSLFPPSTEITGECQPYASEGAACGDCGEKTRTCDGQCHWGSWSGCSGEGICSPYASQSETCGSCGQRQRTCTSSCGWGSWTGCQGEGECAPGQTSSTACGNCGEQTRTCSGACSWSGWSSCLGQGECTPGAQQSGACGQCGEQARTCSSSCGWQSWSQCADQGECSPGASEQQACGRCGQQARSCDGTCGWSAWGQCTGEGACTPGQTEQRPCAAGCGVEERVCGQGCAWGAWGSCSGVAPCVAGTTESEACGACGVRSRSCEGCAGWSAWSSCSGEGECAPGATVTEACGGGCGERARSCGASCGWSTWSACPSDAQACDDANPCTTDACVAGSCQTERVPLCCADGAACPVGTATMSYACESGVCVPHGSCASAADCVDGDPCTADACDVANGACTWTPVAGCCQGPADCDDGDACTTDSCGGDHRCAHAGVACEGRACSADGCCGTCPPGSSCDASGQCSGGSIPCDGAHPEAGRCDGETLYACVDGVGVERDCATAGMHCRPGSTSPLVMGCVVGCGAASSAVCVGDVVYFCVDGQPWSDDCERYGLSCGALGTGGVGCVEACPAACPPGTHCEGARCVSDGGTQADPDPDPADVGGVPGQSGGGGCAGGSGGGGSWLLLGLGVWALLRRRRCTPGASVSLG